MKRKLDQHFTPDDTAALLAEYVVDRYDPERRRFYVEPSAGTGAFMKGLWGCGIPRDNICTVDLDPELCPDYCEDFLGFNPPDPAFIGNCIVIGNPPFGVQGTTALKFIKRALTFSNVCCFIVPRSIVKANKDPYPYNIRDKVNGKPIKFDTTHANCVWAEYSRCPEGLSPPMQIKAPKLPLRGIEFVGKGEVDDNTVILQRCGSGLGSVTKCNSTGQGKYYIRTEGPRIRRAVEAISGYLEYVPEVLLSTHQPSLSMDLVQRLTQIAYFDQNYREVF